MELDINIECLPDEVADQVSYWATKKFGYSKPNYYPGYPNENFSVTVSRLNVTIKEN